MKKLIALLMALILLGGVAVAEKETFIFDETNPGYEGAWLEEKDAGLRIYLPAGYAAKDATDQPAVDPSGFYRAYLPADFKSSLALSASPFGADGAMPAPSLDILLPMYQLNGDVASIVSVNGTDWILCRSEAVGSLTLVTLANDTIFTVSFVLVDPKESRDELLALGDKVIKSATLIQE